MALGKRWVVDGEGLSLLQTWIDAILPFSLVTITRPDKLTHSAPVNHQLIIPCQSLLLKLRRN